jgi:predicted Zn-dependent protease
MEPALDTEATLAELDSAVGAGVADELEVVVLARAGEYTRFAGQRIHQPQAITEVQYLVRAVVDGPPYRVATSVGRDLDRVVREAGAGARQRAALAGSSGEVQLARPGVDDVPAERLPELWHDDTAAFDTAARTSAAQRTMAEAVATGGEAAGMFGRAVTQQIVLTSGGVRRSTTATEASGALTVTVEDGTAHWVDVDRSADRLALEANAADAVAKAAAGRGRVELPPGEYVAVLGPEAIGELLQFLPAFGLSGALAAAGIGLTHRGVGADLPDWIAVADDALADVGLPIGFDIEGVTKQRVPFLEHGAVGRPVTDLATARALGTASTGHAHIAREQVPEPAAANIVMSPGTASEAELVAGVERGVYLQRFWYTRPVDATATTITGVTRDACFVIEDGRLTKPLAGMRFTESLLGVLGRAEAVASELRSLTAMNVWNSATSAPALRTGAFRLGAASSRGDR